MKLSKNLKIQVFRDGKQIVNMSMPIYSASVLDTVIPDSILPKLKEKGIDLKKLMQEMKNDNYAPRTLFSMETDEKSYKVWIE